MAWTIERLGPSGLGLTRAAGGPLGPAAAEKGCIWMASELLLLACRPGWEWGRPLTWTTNDAL